MVNEDNVDCWVTVIEITSLPFVMIKVASSCIGNRSRERLLPPDVTDSIIFRSSVWLRYGSAGEDALCLISLVKPALAAVQFSFVPKRGHLITVIREIIPGWVVVDSSEALTSSK